MRIDLNTPVTLDTAKGAAAAFWSWWTGELRAMLPENWRAWLEGAFERHVVSFDGRTLRLGRRGQDGEGVRLDLDAPVSATRDLIERLEPGALVRRLDVRLPQSGILLRRLRVPVSAGAHIRSVVRLQLERLSPFAPDDVLFDCRKLGESDGEIDVDVGIVPKATLSTYEEQLATLGLAAGRFEVAGTALIFRPVRQSWTGHERLLTILATAAAAAIAAVLVLAPIMRDSELAGLSDEVAALRGPALQAAAARDTLHRLEQPLVAASGRLAVPSALDTLQALTGAVPDSAELSALALDGDRVRLEGTAASAARVIALMKRSGNFQSPHFASPPQRADHGLNRFVIEAQSVEP